MTIPLDNKLYGLQEQGRSKLIFEFYKGGSKIIRVLDFFENIMVKESQKANLITYNPISRGGSLYGYAGSKSRTFSVNFNLTIPNILHVSKRAIGSNKKLVEKRGDFFVYDSVNTVDGEGIPKGVFQDSGENSPTLQYDTNFMYTASAVNPEAAKRAFGGDVEAAIAGRGAATKGRRGALDVLQFWVNLIRSSVVNSAQDPTLSPPIIRLRHGALYQDVPCVCESYNIAHDEKAGYDRNTLLPRVIKVSMKLNEYRRSSLNPFVHQDPENRDVLAGWESVVMTGDDNKHFSMDPGVLGLADASYVKDSV